MAETVSTLDWQSEAVSCIGISLIQIFTGQFGPPGGTVIGSDSKMVVNV